MYVSSVPTHIIFLRAGTKPIHLQPCNVPVIGANWVIVMNSSHFQRQNFFKNFTILECSFENFVS